VKPIDCNDEPQKTAIEALERELEQGAAEGDAGSPRPCWTDGFAASGGKTPVW
jgi:hypothetical protein